MKINMSKEMYEELRKRCAKTKVEISGIMSAERQGEDINIKEIWTDINCIKSNSKKEINYDTDIYIDKTIDEMLTNNIHIRYHTHPGFNSVAHLSQTDKRHTIGRNSIAGVLSKELNIPPITIIDGIVTRRDMAFYLYDEKNNANIRIPLFVDGKEIIPFHEITGKYYDTSSRKGR